MVHCASCRGTETDCSVGTAVDVLNDVEVDTDGTAAVRAADDCAWWCCWPVLFPTDICSIPRLLLEFTNVGCADVVVGVVSVAGCSTPATRLFEDVGGPGKGDCPQLTPPPPPPTPPTPPPPVTHGEDETAIVVDGGTLGNGRRERGPMQQQSVMLVLSSRLAEFSGHRSVSLSRESLSLELLFRRLSCDSSREFNGGRLSWNSEIEIDRFFFFFLFPFSEFCSKRVIWSAWNHIGVCSYFSICWILQM